MPKQRMWISNNQSIRNRQGPTAAPTEGPSPPIYMPKPWVLQDSGNSHVLELREHGLAVILTQKSTKAYKAELCAGPPYGNPTQYRRLLAIHHADSRDQAIEKLAKAFETWAKDRTEDILFAHLTEEN